MNSLSVSATYARNNFFELLDKVSAGLIDVVIKKDNREVAVFSKKNTHNAHIANMTKALDSLVDVIDADELANNPLRKLEAASFLGKWDSK
jgi:antitoxin (DNA-binding transcriptional repressor) of toxin-antitoxin stability system